MSVKKHNLTWFFLKWRASAFIVLGMKSQAMEVFEQMLQQFPNDAYAIGSLAFMKTELGDKEGAIADYKRLTLLSEVSAATWYNLGFLQEELGQVQDAEHSFRQAIKLNEKLDLAWYGLGLALIQLQRFDEAIKALKKNTTLQPMSPYAWYQLAKIYVERNQPDEASKIIHHLKQFEPKFAKQLEQETGLTA
ncbi:tetratricopeptide repeat protein [Polynucleobacter antarcticus]|uniref:Pilus assembly protein PilF n=1 Tax=Polynucleobacter antarcticus TaxID=1743162 RepID=A0A6M9PRN6_9BURK|nr:tetratricopeptide repeat protein [Polynucleobacter antarcticus]QKM63319.1 pilus assembly protein PilF [Polynucleobacter antarcticus]